MVFIIESMVVDQTKKFYNLRNYPNLLHHQLCYQGWNRRNQNLLDYCSSLQAYPSKTSRQSLDQGKFLRGAVKKRIGKSRVKNAPLRKLTWISSEETTWAQLKRHCLVPILLWDKRHFIKCFGILESSQLAKIRNGNLQFLTDAKQPCELCCRDMRLASRSRASWNLHCLTSQFCLTSVNLISNSELNLDAVRFLLVRLMRQLTNFVARLMRQLMRLRNILKRCKLQNGKITQILQL